MIGQYYYGTGRRKTAVARVFMKPGSGTIVVNDKPVDEYFGRETGRMVVRQPLVLVDRLATFDVELRIGHGAGSYRWVRLRGVCLRDSLGRASRFVSRMALITATPGPGLSIAFNAVTATTMACLSSAMK